MQPISNRLITWISAGTPDERALKGGNLPIEESANSSDALEESGENSTAESRFLTPLTNSGSETGDSSGMAEGMMSSAEIPAKPDARIRMNPDDFRKRLNSGTLPDGPIVVTADLTLTDDDAFANLLAGLTVGGSLKLRGCTALTSLPEGLTVDRDLKLRGRTSLRSLPSGLTVRGSLDLKGCISLTSLQAGLTVGEDLDLEGCRSLTSLPAGLTVGGHWDLRYCVSLTSLPEGLTVGGNLNLWGCTSLRSLPAGLTVGGDLNLSDCRSLTSLPAGLTVGGDLYLKGCILLTSLPERLSVGGGLSLSYCRSLTLFPSGLTLGGDLDLGGCTALTSLPAGLTVSGDLYLIECASLTSLPAGLTVGGYLDLEGCTSLTSLPNWITELGPMEDGSVREVDLVDTGLSDALIDRLRRVEAPGMRFLFSRQAAAVEDAFTSIDAAISFWKSLVEDAPSVSLSLETGEEKDLIDFLTRLTATAEYKNILARSVLAKRICDVLKKMEDEEFKKRASLIIQEGLSTCHDRIIHALDELDLMLQVEEAEEAGKREELRKLGRGMLMLEEVQKAALSHAQSLTWVDEIEILLAFQIGLKDRLKLPLATGYMIFRGCAHVSDEEIQQVGAEIERRVSNQIVDEYLLTWLPWQKLLRREAFDAFEPELQEAPADLRWECCLLQSELTEGYIFKGNLFARESLRRVYVDKGVDPFTNEVIELAELKKVIKIPGFHIFETVKRRRAL